MKKFGKAIAKNFKILFRKKTSLLAVIFGPLFVILLIGLAFSSSQGISISIGYNAPDESALTHEIVDMLSETHETTSFPNKESCVKQLEQGLIHTCVIFPSNFVVEEGNINNITFVVDKSRLSIVYAVIDSVSDKIGMKSEELSKDLASALTSVLSQTSDNIDTNLGILIKVKKNVNDALANSEEAKSKLDNVDLESVDVDVDYTSELGGVKNDLENIADSSIDTARDGLELIEDIRNIGNVSHIDAELNELESTLEDLNETANTKYNDSSVQLNNLIQSVSSSADAVQTLKDKLAAGKTAKNDNLNRLTEMNTQLATASQGLEEMKTNLELTAKSIREIKVTSSDQIVNPINTNIETVSAENNQLIILFPYVLLLIIMFVGLMLSSTLVIVEKKSKASFRVFTTPTRDEFYLFTAFITSFIIVALQTLVILLLTNYFFSSLIAQNLLMNIIILVLAASIFIMMGMAIGYMASTQQSTNMLSISVGAILLFISNIVLPLESLSLGLQRIAEFNPYVLTSEMLRRSILFQTNISSSISSLGILLGYSLLIVVLIIVAQRVSKNSFFKKGFHIQKKKDLVKGFRIKGNIISNEKEFVRVIVKLTDKEFQDSVAINSQAKKFIKNTLKKPNLAKKLKKLNKKDLLKEIVSNNKAKIEEIKRKSKNYRRK